MMLPLLLSLVVSGVDDPPVKVWLNHDNYFQRGDKARVNVRLADDGYVLVLRADADGRVRVLFPLDPSSDNFVRGHETIEVRGRGDREAFFVDDREGSGLVFAARSAAPFKFDEFVRGDHWDYRVLDARQSGDDKEAALLDMVQRMTPDSHFDYDVVTYVVSTTRAYYDSYYPHYTAYSVGFGWGWPYYSYGRCYDPFFYDPFFCYDRIFYGPYRYGFYGYPYRFYGYPYRPFIYYGGGYAFYGRPRNTFINRVRTGSGGVGVHMTFKDRVGTNAPSGGIGPRFRVPEGTLIARGRPETSPVRERDAMQRRESGRGSTAFPVRERSDRPDRAVPVDREGSSERSSPAARETGRRSPSNGGSDRGAARSSERRGGGGGGGGGWSAPRGSSGGGGDRGVRSPPSNRGGGGSADRGGGGNRGNSGGGSRRRP